MIVTSPEAVQLIFDKWRLPARFSESELAFFKTLNVVDLGPSVLAFPTPSDNIGLNILNLRRLLGVDPMRPPSFFDHPWYLDEPFGREICSPGWHFLSMEVRPDTIDQSYNYCSSAFADSARMPRAIEVVLMLFLHFEQSGKQLLMKKHTWCADEASLGRRVTVGAFGRNGVFISGHPPTFSSKGLGLCPRYRHAN